MTTDIEQYHLKQTNVDLQICNLLHVIINTYLTQAENKLWHGHPVWFINGNPIVGYSKQKNGIKLLFWSGADFEEPHLSPGSGKFKDAGIFYNTIEGVKESDVKRWLQKSKTIQWDYKNIVKRKGQLIKLEL